MKKSLAKRGAALRHSDRELPREAIVKADECKKKVGEVRGLYDVAECLGQSAVEHLSEWNSTVNSAQ